MRRDIVILLLGALACVLLQIILAPNIAIFAAMPNILLVYALTIAILRPNTRAILVIAFVLGLSFDLMSHTPVGAMAFLLVLFAYVVTRVFNFLDNGSILASVVLYCAAAFTIEIIYSLFMMMFGISAGLMDALLYRALPCALYDCIIALLLYPLMLRVLAKVTPASSTPKTTSVGPTSRGTINVSTGNRRRLKKSKKMPRF